MSVKSCENLEKSQVKLTIEVGAEEFEKAVNKAYMQMRGKMNVPGFRPGKAPRKMIESMYGAEIFYEEAVNAVLPDAYESAVDEQKLEVVGYPQVEIESVGKEGAVFKCTVAVYPEVELGQYKGLEAVKAEVKVMAADVNARLKEMADRNSRLVAVERAVKKGDTANIDFEGFDNGVAFEGGKGDAFVSAGSTGALHVGASLIVRTLRGVKRPALATMVPAKQQAYLLLDCGANVECRPEMLAAFAVMGSCYVNKVEGRKNPSVALANNGAEESKGTPVLRDAHQLLKTTPGIRFVGNIEPRDVPNGEVDVVVCDGFTGNVILKLTEGVAKMLLGMLKQMFLANLGGKLAYLLLKSGITDLKHQMDSEEYGGAPFLGAKQPVIKAHGSSKAKGIKNAIRQAKICVENDLCGTMQSALDELAAAQKTEE